jgi:hypothetical protein|tara:strand:+ start:84 stop:530 length:447 start_codon:yes stop_codon:yes gene_type:complete
MNNKTLHNLVWMPIFFIGLLTIILGLGWLFYPEPWVLDRIPNEIILKISFKELFAANINTHLPDYLKMIYRFFGWWVVSIGLLVVTYVYVTRMGTHIARNAILIAIFIVLSGVYLMIFRFIPTTPFLYGIYGVTALFLLSLWASRQIN